MGKILLFKHCPISHQSWWLGHLLFYSNGLTLPWGRTIDSQSFFVFINLTFFSQYFFMTSTQKCSSCKSSLFGNCRFSLRSLVPVLVKCFFFILIKDNHALWTLLVEMWVNVREEESDLLIAINIIFRRILHECSLFFYDDIKPHLIHILCVFLSISLSQINRLPS